MVHHCKNDNNSQDKNKSDRYGQEGTEVGVRPTTSILCA